jgi:hypothetical protein
MSALADSFLSGERVITTERRPVDGTDLDNPACTRRAWM